MYYFTCKKSLNKSTYGKKNAFTKNKCYVLQEDDGERYWITDELNNLFSFSKVKNNVEYYIYDYFY